MTTQPAGRTAPGPKSKGILADILAFQTQDMIEMFMDAWKQYGDVVRFKTGPLESYLLIQPEHIHHVLVKNASNYTKGISMDKLKLSLGEGLFASEGSLWRRQRHLMQPMFTPRAINSFAEMMIEDIDVLLKRWEGYAASGQAVDVNQEMMRLAMGIIARTMFGMSIDQDAMDAAAAFSYVLEFVSQKTTRILDVPMFVPTAANLQFKRAMKTLDAFIFGVVDRRLADPASAEQNDLLALLMRARDPETGEPMSRQQIRDEVITIFFAGHETTAQAMTWTWFLMAQHPDVERRLHAELDEHLQGRTPTLEELEALPYTSMVINEAMRLYPPILFFARQALEADNIGGYHIPKGAMITLSQYITHRHPDFWAEPETFNPENFAEENEVKRPRYAYFPFGGGQRVCIGNNFALLEMALALSMIGQRFEVRLEPGQTIRPRMVGTLRPNGPVMVKIQKRQKA